MVVEVMIVIMVVPITISAPAVGIFVPPATLMFPAVGAGLGEFMAPVFGLTAGSGWRRVDDPIPLAGRGAWRVRKGGG